MRIALIEPFYGGSHKAWADGLSRNSRHDVEIFGLSDRFWKWRMQDGAITLARDYLSSSASFDLILASDMLNLPVFLAASREVTANLPVALYFHENQMTYPWSRRDRDLKENQRNFGFVNYSSAYVSSVNLFNSAYNLSSFIEGTKRIMEVPPKSFDPSTYSAIVDKCEILPLGLDLVRLDLARESSQRSENSAPVILWNHRWEYDKDPQQFFEVLMELSKRGLDFKLIVVGEELDHPSSVFKQARLDLTRHVLHWGYVESPVEYARFLWQADLLPVTSRQDFFGGSVAEAIYCGCYPLLPDRLAFPELLPAECREEHLYSGKPQLFNRLLGMLDGQMRKPSGLLRDHVMKYDWGTLIEDYDRRFDSLLV